MRYPELKQLNCFREVARAGHFGRAARSLAMSHSALSEQILRLEATFGRQLLHRDRKGVVPTPEGGLLLEHVDLILRRVDDAMQAIQIGANSETPRLHIGLSDAAFGTAVPNALQALRNEVPDIHIQITECGGIDAERALFEDGLDCLFIAYPPQSDQLVSTSIGMVSLAACFPKDHPFAAKSSIDLVDLDDQHVIFVGNYPHRRMHSVFHQACAEVGARPKIGASARQLLTVFTLVAGGFGIGIVQGQLTPPTELKIESRPIANSSLLIPTNFVRTIGTDNPMVTRLETIIARQTAAAA